MDCSEENTFVFEDIIDLDKRDIQLLLFNTQGIDIDDFFTIALKNSTQDMQNHILTSMRDKSLVQPFANKTMIKYCANKQQMA